MQTLALYLPQFHRTAENDQWWGDHFTEWTNVRRAQPLYPGHVQPQVPLGGNYYDLTNPDTLVWQADLAARHGLGGFVFFHYWYEGKLLLERPVELWRHTAQARLPFCLCWANHPWTRSWDGKEHQILQPQTYGGQADWDRHLDYLLGFFHDPRHIQIDGAPVVFLYNASAIPRVNQMVEHWQNRLVAEGFNGLYLVEYISSKNPKPACELSRAVYEDEPVFSARFQLSAARKAARAAVKRLNRPDYQDYNHLWRLILAKRQTYGTREIVQGAFTAWDNSPRRGRKGPMVVRGASPEQFGHYLAQLLSSKRPMASQDLLVVNAWNEWGEGAMLEPTEQHGLGYLQALSQAMTLT